MALAGWWGYSHGGTSGLLQALWITAVLGVLEVSLSFDNAVVNASVLRHWNEFWRKLFLTVGILVAVFGMRLMFPLLIVSVATGLGLLDVWHMATTTPGRVLAPPDRCPRRGGGLRRRLPAAGLPQLPVRRRKGTALAGLDRRKVGDLGTEGLAILLTLAAVFGCMSLVPEAAQAAVLTSGVVGVIVYVGVDWISGLLEEGG
jgi:hypothetical protein